MKYFRSHWRGEQSLLRSYWINSVLIVSLAAGVYGVINAYVVNLGFYGIVLGSLAISLALTAVLIWAYRGTWKSSTRVERLIRSRFPNSFIVWPGLAKAALVFGSISSAFLIGGNLIDKVSLAITKDEIENGEYIVEAISDTNLYFSGMISKTTLTPLLEALGAEGRDTLIINSAGGVIDSAIALASFIHGHAITVVVDRYCQSACLLLLAAAPDRVASPDSLLQFHDPEAIGSTLSSQSKTNLALGRELYLKEYEHYGITRDWLTRWTETRFTDIPLKEAIEAGLVNVVVTADGEISDAASYCAAMGC